MEKEFRRLYLSEFKYFDGTNDVTLNIVDVCKIRNEIAVAVTNEGKISVQKFDLKKSDDGRFFFEYGLMRKVISVNDFEQVED